MRSWLLIPIAAIVAIGCGSKKGDDGAAVAGDDGGEATIVEPAEIAAAGTRAPADPFGVEAQPRGAHLPHPLAECPVGAEARSVDSLLDQAASRYDAGEFGVAFACAEGVADLMPQSVEAHHLRAAALAAMGHYDAAQVAFTMALALDPDDPETLAAAADFYINVLPPKRRETTLVGLEFARRGRDRAVSRRRSNRQIRARLALLESQAYNDLGRADEALELLDEAIKLAPSSVEARHERGVSLFNMCRFDKAVEAFSGVLGVAPDDPYAHHHLGLIYERLGREPDAEVHFARARQVAPADFWQPVLLTPEAFRAELREAMDELSPEMKTLLEGVKVEVADLPAVEDLTAVDPPFAPTILGLFRGFPHGIEPAGARSAQDRTIILYRKNLARAVKTREELDRQIRRTLLHELGHLAGLDEDELRRRGLD